jgi:hypothetical protein
VEAGNAHLGLDAAAIASAVRPRVERRRRLSAAALAVTNQKVGRAFSPIVITGAVRVFDFIVLSAIGIALYFGCAVSAAGAYWELLAAIIAMAGVTVICFQAAGIYEVQVFRGQLGRTGRMVASWTFAFLLFVSRFRPPGLHRSSSSVWLRWWPHAWSCAFSCATGRAMAGWIAAL